MMKPALQTALVIVFTLPYFAASDTVYEVLSRSDELSEFYKMVNKDEVLQVLLDRRTVTVFAPTNEAIRRVRRRFEKEQTTLDETKFPSFHILNFEAGKSMFPATVSPYVASVAPLYLNIKEPEIKGRKREYFVNNAKIIRQSDHRGTEGGKQLLYVIDDIVEPFMSIAKIPPSALDFLKQPNIYGLKYSLDAFSSRVTAEKDKNHFQHVSNHTFFLPIGAVDNENVHKLQNIDEWVVTGHIIEKQALFTRTMSRKSYRSMTYNDKLKVELTLTNDKLKSSDSYDDDDDEDFYIQSNTIQGDETHWKGVVRAKIVRPNICVTNGVVHLISHPLMIIDKTILDFIEKSDPIKDNLRQFLQLIKKYPGFRDNTQKTVFAPTDRAFSMLDKEKLNRVLSNTTAANNLLELHMVTGSVTTQEVWNKNVTSLKAYDNKRKLYFRAVGEERNKTLTVEGGGVNSTVIMADIGATNGILHIIDGVLGMPYLTIYKKLEHDPDLETTFALSKQEEWSLKLNDKDKSYTFFVPNKKAWENLRNEMPSEHKQLHMGLFSYHVQKILDRHLVVGTALKKDDLLRQNKIQMVHGMFKIDRRQADQLQVEWEGLQANIVRGDVEATNGIIHVIDKVMMKRRDLTKSGSGSYHSGFSSFVFFPVFITFCLEALLNRMTAPTAEILL